jgi:hypothetical protein
VREPAKLTRFGYSLGLAACVACATTPDVSANTAPHPSSNPAPASAAPSAPPSASGAPNAAAPSASAAPSTAASTAPAAGPAPEPAPKLDQHDVYAAGALAASASPPLVDQSGKPLPQTDEHPSTKTATFPARMQLLAHAIITGDAEGALPAFFPQVAYARVKDIPKPERDWETRLVAAFRRNVAEYHAALGARAGEATFAGVDVPEQNAKFMKPGSEGNRVPYYRVLRSTLRLRTAEGKERAFEVTSMISWRGEWYVVHLHGFK